MAQRSWLTVPADSESGLIEAVGTGADVVIIDLADSVSPSRRDSARTLARDWLGAHRRQVLQDRKLGRWVRINALDSRMWREDLIAVLPGAPDGIVLPRSTGPESLQQLAAELYEVEQRSGVQANSTRILPMVSGTASAAIGITSYAECSLPRLAGLGWNAGELGSALGATRTHDEHGNWSDAFRHVRAQVLLTAHARGIIAVDTPLDDSDDKAAIERAARTSRADGFTGMFAVNRTQVEAINRAFTPSEDELADARAVLAAHNTEGSFGAAPIERRMGDRPQLRFAQRLLGVEE
jgi:citrate lyase subunit beta / citryl-CoA lyase